MKRAVSISLGSPDRDKREQVSDQIVWGDLMVALGILIPVWGLANFKRVARR